MTDAITRSLRRIESRRAEVLRRVENVRGFHDATGRVNLADRIASEYDEVIRILREEQRNGGGNGN